MTECETIKLPGKWALRKLSLTGRSEWALQFMGMDWIRISEFLPQNPPRDALDNDIRNFAAAMNDADGEDTPKAKP